MKIHTAAALFGLLCAATDARAQGCSWERERVPRGRAAQEDSVQRALRGAQDSSIRRAAIAAGVAEPRGVVLFTMEPNGSNPFAAAFDGNIPQSVIAALVPEMVERAKALPGRRAGRIAMVSKMDTLPLPPARADGKRLECGPRPTNAPLIANALQQWMQGQPQGAVLGRQAIVNLLVSGDGRVLHTEIQRPSGYAPLDEFATEVTRLLVFRPASLDGVGRDVMAQLPIAVRSPLPNGN
jgi:hypothetical protein